jgi:exodeoxyribonuclease-1
MTHSLFWHDYETSGTHPQKDRPLQFAGVRTDLDFNVIDEPISIYCKLALDTLPHPDACLLTGITPTLIEEKGMCEAAFARLIHDQLAQPYTCSLGYNSVRFDDEVTRHLLYRNFYDAYEREWQNGNSRWDLLDVFRAAQALRPDGLNWVYDKAEGSPLFKLDQLTIANDIKHEEAHNALSDVYATLSLANLLRKAQPRLFQFLFEHRTKTQALKLLNVGKGQPLVHVSGMYPASKNCLAIVLPLCIHPKNINEIIVYDVGIDPTPLIQLAAEDIKARLFVATESLPENVRRIPLKTVHINKCPVLAPLNVLRAQDVERLGLDLEESLHHSALLSSHLKQKEFNDKMAAVFEKSYRHEVIDVDLALYSGGFFSAADKQMMTKIRHATPDALANVAFAPHEKNDRLQEMLFRYRARNYPSTLTSEEWQKWRDFCISKLSKQNANTTLLLTTYLEHLYTLESQHADPVIMQDLRDYLQSKLHQLDIDLNVLKI